MTEAEDYIRELLAIAPPLSPERRQRLAEMLAADLNLPTEGTSA